MRVYYLTSVVYCNPAMFYMGFCMNANLSILDTIMCNFTVEAFLPSSLYQNFIDNLVRIKLFKS